MFNAKLPNSFKFNPACDLVRIGGEYDGGYLVSKSDIKNCELLISLGIFDDWRFEKDFIQISNRRVEAYDGSLSLRFWITRSIIQTLKNPFNFYIFRKFFSYKSLFKGKNKLFKKYVGLNSDNVDHCTLDDILKNKTEKNIFLKIDIENSEYRLLDQILLYENKICGMVIEFHDCDIHLEKITNFLNETSLTLVHVHANNYAPIRLDDKLPITLELTFSKNSDTMCFSDLPHKFDMPNDKHSPEIKLNFV